MKQKVLQHFFSDRFSLADNIAASSICVFLFAGYWELAALSAVFGYAITFFGKRELDE